MLTALSTPGLVALSCSTVRFCSQWYRLSLLVLCSVLATSISGRAEQLITSLSQESVKITSNFTGTEIVVFGSIERDGATVARASGYDVVIIVSGARQPVVARRKERTLGLWINRTAHEFYQVPSFYSLNSNREIGEISTGKVLERNQIGVDNLLLLANVTPEIQEEVVSFREALLRLRRSKSLFVEQTDAVEFLSTSLFRTTIALPAIVPVGEYRVDIFLFRGGALLANNSRALEIRKTGFEQLVYGLAHENSLVYGLGTIILALTTGWLAGVIFRKD